MSWVQAAIPLIAEVKRQRIGIGSWPMAASCSALSNADEAERREKPLPNAFVAKDHDRPFFIYIGGRREVADDN
jgi:hypothetical protein